MDSPLLGVEVDLGTSPTPSFGCPCSRLADCTRNIGWVSVMKDRMAGAVERLGFSTAGDLVKPQEPSGFQGVGLTAAKGGPTQGGKERETGFGPSAPKASGQDNRPGGLPNSFIQLAQLFLLLLWISPGVAALDSA